MALRSSGTDAQFLRNMQIADMTGKNLEEILKIQQKDLQVEDENKN